MKNYYYFCTLTEVHLQCENQNFYIESLVYIGS